MAQRYSRSEKEKWITGTNKTTRRSPVRIPESDNSSLIEENKFTLIGRVTNPLIQKPKAVVSYFPQFWNLDSTVTGRDLGSDRFLFKFESEEALQSVLRRGPYHYKRWILILQRWEPIASDLFPALISFWVKIHGLPVHQWTPQTIRTIGSEIGQLSNSETGLDAANGRVRVQLNGLEPLEMLMPVRMPQGEVISVELEYEKLEKHCFTCFSLLHEENDCPRLRGKTVNPYRVLGINQQKTLLKLEADKQKSDSRRDATRSSSTLMPKGGTSKTPARPPPRTAQKHYTPPKPHSGSYHHRDLSRQQNSPPRPLPRYSSRPRSEFSRDQGSPTRSNRLSHSRTYHSGSHRPSATHNRSPRSQLPYLRDNSPVRFSGSGARSIQENRLSSPSLRPEALPTRNSGNKGKEIASNSPKSRRPALERISHHTPSEMQSQVPTASSNSNRLQDVTIQYLEDSMQRCETTTGIGESSRTLRTAPHRPLEARLSFPSTSTALPAARVHASLRLEAPIDSVTVTLPPTKVAAKPGRKRKTAAEKAQASAAPRGARSPLSGASLKKQNITRSKSKASPKKRLRTDILPEFQDGTSAAAHGGPPLPVMIPAISKSGVDFQNPPSLLP